MDNRPPRAQPPRNPATGYNAPPAYHPQHLQKRDTSAVKFSEPDQGDAGAYSPINERLSPSKQYTAQPLFNSYNTVGGSAQGNEHGEHDGSYSAAADMRRKKSLVRPDRERIDPGHRQWFYRNHAAQMENEGAGRVGVQPSTTGNAPQQPTSLRRGRSLLAREEDVQESGLSLFKRGATLRRKPIPVPADDTAPRKGIFASIPGPHDAWMYYCYIMTACFPPFLLRCCGIRSPEQQRAWREKMGLVWIIVQLMAGVGFVTFGFTQTVCREPPTRYESGSVQTNFLIVHGFAYDLGTWKHPAVAGVFSGTANPLFESPYNAGGMDASFMFQKVNQKCSGIITLPTGSSISVDAKGNLGWYFPCNLYNQYGTTGPTLTGYDSSKGCHTEADARTQFNALSQNAQVYYTWNDVMNSNRNLAVYESNVLDMSLLNWLDKSQVKYPALFDEMKTKNGTFNEKDLSMFFLRSNQKALGACLKDIITVGFIDTSSIGCVASKVVLYVSLVFIIGVVAIKFCMAVIFGWFLSWKIGAFKNETYEQRMQRAREIENWTDNIHSSAPARYRPNVKPGAAGGGGVKSPYAGDRKTIFLPTTSRFSKADNTGKGSPVPGGRPGTLYGGGRAGHGGNSPSGYLSSTKFLSPERGSRSSTSLGNYYSSSSDPVLGQSACPWPLHNVVPQPPPDYEPNNYPLAHTICLVTAYSESVEGLRTTLDSLATTDYANSHKLIMVIADGMVKGSGNALTTPEIVIGMMKEFIIPVNEVQPHSYVAIADGHKRHNMAKVYAGFYDYSDATVEPSKQQRVPMVLVAKVGNPLEANDAKPGNRGKRDSQIVLMGFLQKVMFDERMTTFEYEFFNSIWRVTGVSPDRYEIVLCVDADTKVFPDSVTRMVACMVDDEEIMGLCGETKIANKGETWVTMIQVFEYYISHHLTKAFESMFGGVTCLPGCFSMYRIKAPKGNQGFWVPILANPDIVEHYSENIVDTLHKKNLLLLGEDRYLTTLMLKTFPKRKMIFCPQAVCKTIVPDTFSVLLSQRRRWINSTVHNLAELMLVRDLCGTFCFSMQFVVFMELTGTLVLPAAIAFTVYLIIDTFLNLKNPPVIPLILLGIILGLPGLLIVVTSRKVAYIGWMFIYLASLPVWNFVLPAYSFWHFDDFSWGQTRMVAGEKAGGHGDKEGEFDSTHIVMKRWAEFERDRRFKSGTHSRDSTYYDVVQRNGSPKRDSKRFSVVSTTEMPDAYMPRPQLPYGTSPGPYESGESSNGYHNGQRSRGELMLPAPLSAGLPRGKLASENDEHYGAESASNHRLIPSPQDAYASSPVEDLEPPRMSDDRYRRPSPPPHHTNTSPVAVGGGGVKHSAMANNYPGETFNPYRNSLPQTAQATVARPSSDQGHGTDDEEFPRRAGGGKAAVISTRAARGVSLVDHGPVVPAGSEARRVPRPSARKQQPATTTAAVASPKPSGSQPLQPQIQPYHQPDERRSSSRQQPVGPPPGAANILPPGQRWNDPRYQ
ncbi:Chitin synthase, class 3 [Tulasnella sp. JGI-2019a]|nr:Chitin synthase, class 3 [Tulasnella sp. JGI-2019a]